MGHLFSGFWVASKHFGGFREQGVWGERSFREQGAKTPSSRASLS